MSGRDPQCPFHPEPEEQACVPLQGQFFSFSLDNGRWPFTALLGASVCTVPQQYPGTAAAWRGKNSKYGNFLF